ncbi:hypothetical protein LTR17_006436 [Elasticomyces elasticus]|nr:hypothetical protein LTR17_006436 [Elasticomyces elasticus]
MSTFDGVVKEFPDIRIDYFRPSTKSTRAPLAYFLSHIHTDHTVGLESCKSPFIYCSPATREILLRLQKFPHRMNFAKGIVEKHEQHFKHLKKLLKPIPLETPTDVELSPGNTIRVTLFDANHCVGAVCFLIEGNGKAILYTGDVRAEPWWIASLCRHPLIVPYVASVEIPRSPLKQLNCLYLDTTFAAKEDVYKQFPSKASGLTEMLHAVSRYPRGTTFYFDSWTFGQVIVPEPKPVCTIVSANTGYRYEEVWQALCAHLGCQIHVDDYRYGLYLALSNGAELKAPEATKLMGYNCGNHPKEGCLTSKQTKLHSCEKGAGCEVWDKDFVRITPIISRHNGMDIAELGAGGGQGDLDVHHELDVGDAATVGQLIALCASKLQGQPQLLASVMELLTSFISGQKSTVSLDGSGFTEACARAAEEADFDNVDDFPIDRLVPALAKLVTKAKQQKLPSSTLKVVPKRADGLAKRITFPYSRHSSYGELCELVDAFKAKDVHPCTVDSANWTTNQSMSFLFGHVYTNSPTFSHDQMMVKKRGIALPSATFSQERQSSPASDEADWNRSLKFHRNQENERRLTRKTHEEFERHSNDHLMARRQSDLWPTRELEDHYSPPRQQRKRKSSRALSPDTAAVEALRKASVPFAHPAQWLDHNSALSKRRRPSDDDREGRLSPPAFEAEQSPPHDPHVAALRGAAEGRRLHIGNLPEGTSSADLEIFCADYEVENAYVPQQSASSRAGLYGFVEFANPAAAKHAMSRLRNKVFNDRRVRVDMARNTEAPFVGKLEPILKYEVYQPTADEARLTLRTEAYEAARNNDSVHWSRLGLVSTGGGHQVKEEEL